MEQNPRLIRRGDIIRLKGVEGEEVVRGVTIILHLANGQDVACEPTETIEVVPPEDLSDLLLVVAPEPSQSELEATPLPKLRDKKEEG